MMPRLRHLFCPFALLAAGAVACAQDAPITANLTSATPPAAPAPAAPATTTDTPVDQLPQTPFTDAVAAEVNGKIITLSEVKKASKEDVATLFAEEKADFEANPAKYNNDPNKAQSVFYQHANDIFLETLKNMVDKLLIIQEFTDKGYKVPDYYLERQFEDNMSSQFHDDRETFIKFLAAEGLSELEYRQHIEEDDEVGYMADQMHSSTTGLSPDRIKNYYEQHKEDYFVKASIKIRQIVLKPVADSPVAEQAAQIVAAARQPGANFLALAQKYSSDPLAREGILPDQTFTSDNKLPPDVQKTVFQLQPGEVSDPVTTQDPKTGETITFIFICDEKTTEGYRKIEDVYPDIEKTLAAEDDKQAVEKWLQRLRNKAFIKYGVPTNN